MGRKVDQKITVMIDDQLADLIAKVAFGLDCTKSEVIRACILLGIDTISSNPPLISKISINDRFPHQLSTR